MFVSSLWTNPNDHAQEEKQQIIVVEHVCIAVSDQFCASSQPSTSCSAPTWEFQHDTRNVCAVPDVSVTLILEIVAKTVVVPLAGQCVTGGGAAVNGDAVCGSGLFWPPLQSCLCHRQPLCWTQRMGTSTGTCVGCAELFKLPAVCLRNFGEETSVRRCAFTGGLSKKPWRGTAKSCM